VPAIIHITKVVKYLFHINRLAYLLAALQEEYAVLVVEGQRLNRYQTLYFDTIDFALYHRHHMGAQPLQNPFTRVCRDWPFLIDDTGNRLSDQSRHCALDRARDL
jgi:hypothetical protein